jgi:hypothetical protein
MFVASLPDDVYNIEFFSEPGVQLAETNLNFGAKRCERVDALQHFAAKLLLGSLGEAGCLRYREFKCLHHTANLSHLFAVCRT